MPSTCAWTRALLLFPGSQLASLGIEMYEHWCTGLWNSIGRLSGHKSGGSETMLQNDGVWTRVSMGLRLKATPLARSRAWRAYWPKLDRFVSTLKGIWAQAWVWALAYIAYRHNFPEGKTNQLKMWAEIKAALNSLNPHLMLNVKHPHWGIRCFNLYALTWHL